jgi:hypothetical protein
MTCLNGPARVPAPLTINVPDTGAEGPGVGAVPVEDDPQEATNSAAHSAANPVPSLTPRRIGDSFYTARTNRPRLSSLTGI